MSRYQTTVTTVWCDSMTGCLESYEWTSTDDKRTTGNPALRRLGWVILQPHANEKARHLCPRHASERGAQ